MAELVPLVPPPLVLRVGMVLRERSLKAAAVLITFVWPADWRGANPWADADGGGDGGKWMTFMDGGVGGRNELMMASISSLTLACITF